MVITIIGVSTVHCDWLFNTDNSRYRQRSLEALQVGIAVKETHIYWISMNQLTENSLPLNLA